MTGHDRLAAALRALPGVMAPAVRSALEEIAAATVAAAKARLPPGPLADSLSVRAGEGGAVEVVADSPHAMFVEYGTRGREARPFLRPAVAAAASDGQADLATAASRALTTTLDRP